MFRKYRIRKRILVAGLGLAALAAPTTALAGGYSGHAPKSRAQLVAQGYEDGSLYRQSSVQQYGQLSPDAAVYFHARQSQGAQQYGQLSPDAAVYVHATSAQSQGVSIDGRSPDTKDAAVAASTPYGMPDGWTPYVEQLTRESQGSSALIDGRSPDTKDAAVAVQQENLDGRSQNIATFEQGLRLSRSEQVVDGRSPDTRDSAAVAHEPIVTITKTPGFQWGDFGIGTGVALAAVLLLAFMLRRLSNRQDRKPGSVATA